MTEGRSCPLAYRYQPAALCADPVPVAEDVIYVIGGLYGNPFALDEIENMALAEERQGRSVKLVFNGDFNWFNASDELFRDINCRVLSHTAILGNVDYELATPNSGAGCGCAYPEFVSQDVVERSNEIMSRLQKTAGSHPDIQQQLAALPRYQCLMFGGLKVLVLHGDPESLAGWGLAHESFAAGNEHRLEEWFRESGADVMVSTHTCLPVLWSGLVQGRLCAVANNGSSGMGNLSGDARGLITRISRTASTLGPVEGLVSVAGLHLDLMPVNYNVSAWVEQFDQLWPAGSSAAISYRQRLLEGASLSPSDLVFPLSP
ncbi:metallophosphoesterase family protein [Marinobacter sp. KMM 10035]|uniref:metallophosphoesterase family protein n=1 Tax=Marinobacter sp. KMM 10035 TaxID=3134034 RepID=UPI00397AE81F